MFNGCAQAHHAALAFPIPDAAVQQRAELLALVQQVASSEADAAAVVDEIARRLAG